VTNRQNEVSVLWTQATSLMQSYYADKQKCESADQAIVLYDEYLEVSPTDADAWFALGSLLASRGRRRRAIEALETAIRIAPHPCVEYLVNLGLVLQESGEWSEAAKVYEAAIRLKPDNVQVLTNLAIALVRSKRPERSLELFKRASELSPSTEVRLNLATELMRRRSWHDAELVLRQGLLSDPDSRLVLLSLGEVMMMQDRFVEAFAYANEAHAHAPDERSSVLLANVLSLLGCDSEARDVLRAWIAHEPDRWFPLGLLGAVCLQLGNGSDALESFRGAIAVGPVKDGVDDLGRSGRYWADWLRAGLAAALALSGHTEEARSTFEETRRGRSTAAEDFPEFFAYYRGGDTQPG
jgi:Flp pilus assembly protein TadD